MQTLKIEVYNSIYGHIIFFVLSIFIKIKFLLSIISKNNNF